MATEEFKIFIRSSKIIAIISIIRSRVEGIVAPWSSRVRRFWDHVPALQADEAGIPALFLWEHASLNREERRHQSKAEMKNEWSLPSFAVIVAMPSRRDVRPGQERRANCGIYWKPMAVPGLNTRQRSLNTCRGMYCTRRGALSHRPSIY